jgi:hypothetical protein
MNSSKKRRAATRAERFSGHQPDPDHRADGTDAGATQRGSEWDSASDTETDPRTLEGADRPDATATDATGARGGRS